MQTVHELATSPPTAVHEAPAGFDPTLIIFSSRAHRGYELAKRVFDVVGSVVLLGLLSPLLLAIAASVRLAGGHGPVLFRQARVGRHGESFEIFKFRTMVDRAEQLLPADYKCPDDPRVTGVGRVLRSTSMDELPNLLNVLRGEMSLVGPRPILSDESRLRRWPAGRLAVLPGITGLWQVSGRSATGFDERVRLDLEYVERRSLSLDLAILLRTFGVVLARKGAY